MFWAQEQARKELRFLDNRDEPYDVIFWDLDLEEIWVEYAIRGGYDLGESLYSDIPDLPEERYIFQNAIELAARSESDYDWGFVEKCAKRAGIDAALDAYWAGVPFEDIMA